MSDFPEKVDKITVHLKELYTRHKALDEEIKQMYNHWENDIIINRKKTQKLWLKDEIYRLETELKALI